MKTETKIKDKSKVKDVTAADLDEMILPGKMQMFLMLKVGEAVREIDRQLREHIKEFGAIIPDHFDFTLKLKVKPNKATVKEIVVQDRT